MTKKMELKTIKVSKLKGNSGQIDGLPGNPRFIKDEKFKKLVKSLQDDPEMMELREVIAYDNNGELVVIMGNMRLRACIELGIKEVPCKILPPETPLEKLKAYTIKDNVSYGEHDFDMLTDDWDIDLLVDFGVDFPGYDLDGNFNEEKPYNFMNKVTVEFDNIESATLFFEKCTKENLKAKLS
jgi:hypothetical protein